MQICVYRGTNEVGGNCIELSTKNTRILLDMGTPLSSMDEKRPIADYKVPCPGVYADEKPTVDAIFVTHNHGDHYGLLPLVNPKIPVYMSKMLRDILVTAQPLVSDDFDVSHLNIQEIGPNKSVTIGDFTVTARPVDHAPDSYGFEVTDGVKTVVYTGDIRFHSNQKWKSEELAYNCKNPDYLIMEGTRMSRAELHEKYPTEESVYLEITRKIRNSGKIALVDASTQSVDRFCSLIRACIASDRTLVISPYAAHLLDIYHKIHKSVPDYNVNAIRVYHGVAPKMHPKLAAAGLMTKYLDKKILPAEILEHPEKFVIFHCPRLFTSLVSKHKLDYDFIYSLWHGYLNRKKTWNRYKSHLTEIHTSGHADIESLKEFVKVINPAKIIPVHTECKNDFEKTFGVPTLVLNDNERMEL